MVSVQYETEAAWGSKYIDCSVLGKRGNKYEIEFMDYDDKMIRRWVNRDYLKFPSYADMIYC